MGLGLGLGLGLVLGLGLGLGLGTSEVGEELGSVIELHAQLVR